MHATAASRRSWAAEVVGLIDGGRCAEAVTLVSALAGREPDAATACILRHTLRQIEQFIGATARERRTAARAAVHALLAGGAAGPAAPDGTDHGDPLARWPLAIRMLGPLEVWVHGRRVQHWSSRAGRATLRILTFHRGRPVSRELLMDELWPDAAAAVASNRLNVAVHALRRNLCAADPGGTGQPYVTCRDGAYELAPGLATWVDVEQFDSHRALGAAARSAGDATLAAAHFTAAADIYRGPLFEDDGADWHLERRLALQDSGCETLEALAELRLDAGDILGAERACRRLLAIDPCWEGGHRLLMRCLAGRGEYGRAVLQYRRCAGVLARELDVAPDGRTEALYSDVKARLSAGRDPSEAHPPGDDPGLRGRPVRSLRRRHIATEGNTMPQANDAEITDVYTASLGLDVADNEPNSPAPGGAPALTFDLQLEMVAGNGIGGSGANYVLTITCIDETLGAPNTAMTVGPFNQEFQAPLWALSGSAGNFFSKQRFAIPVPANVRGHVFRYVATLVGVNSDIVSFRESNRFILT